jgi:plastocyanin
LSGEPITIAGRIDLELERRTGELSMRLGARRRGLRWWGCGLAALALGAAACGGGSSGHTGAGTSPGATGSTPTSGGTSGGAGSGGGTQVTVGEVEFKLILSTTSFSPGHYTFKTVNQGKIVHSLEITGPGVRATTPNLQPGQSANLDVTLQAGQYDLFCPIDSHKSLGMNAEITVGGGNAG